MNLKLSPCSSCILVLVTSEYWPWSVKLLKKPEQIIHVIYRHLLGIVSKFRF